MTTNDLVTGTVNTVKRMTGTGAKFVPYLKFDKGWASPTGGGYVGGDAIPISIIKFDLQPGNIDGRRFSAIPSVGVSWTCSVTLVEELF